METLFGLVVIAAFSYIAYVVWYVPRETIKRSANAGSDLTETANKADKQ